MFTIRHSTGQNGSNLCVTSRRQIVYGILIGAAMLLGLSGCGQKGELYLVESDSQTIESSSAVLDSTSNPQDAAFAGIDDDNYEKTRYLEQKQVLPDVSDDPNDYWFEFILKTATRPN